MSMGRRSFTKEFKIKLITEIQSGKKISQAAKENQISRTLIHQWLKQYDQYGSDAFAGNGNLYTVDAKIAEYERKIGELTMEIDLLKKANRTIQDNLRRTNKKGGKE